MNERMRYRSLFWPIILIGVGILWLLSNLGYVSLTNISQLWRLWPVLLIVAGLDILIGRRTPAIGFILGLLVVAAVGVFLFSGIQFPGVTGTSQVVTETFQAPIDQAKAAAVDLQFWSDPVTLNGQASSSNIIDTQITHSGKVDFSQSGTTTKTIRLSHTGDFPPDFLFSTTSNRHTDVSLTSAIPLDLSIHTGSGSSQLDLRDLNLSNLQLQSGSGSMQITLPASKVTSPASLHSGSGAIDLTLPAGSSLDLNIDSGSGSVQIQLPANTGVHINLAHKGSGSVNFPSGLMQLSGARGDEGTWETPGYASAANKINLTIHSGSGSVNINQ